MIRETERAGAAAHFGPCRPLDSYFLNHHRAETCRMALVDEERLAKLGAGRLRAVSRE